MICSAPTVSSGKSLVPASGPAIISIEQITTQATLSTLTCLQRANFKSSGSLNLDTFNVILVVLIHKGKKGISQQQAYR